MNRQISSRNTSFDVISNLQIRSFYQQYLFSVLLNLLINGALNIALGLLNTDKHNLIEALFKFSIFISSPTFRPVCVFLYNLSFVISFIFIIVSHTILFKQRRLSLQIFLYVLYYFYFNSL